MMADAAHSTTSRSRSQSNPTQYVVAVTGHQRLGDPQTERFVWQCFVTLLKGLQRRHGADLVVLSGLAEGADTLFAEAAIAQQIPLIAGLAAEGLINNFAPGPARERFLSLRAQSHSVHQLAYSAPSEAAYMALGHWLVDSAHLLIAAWNGLPAAGLGGTADVVAYALHQQKPVVHIHTRAHRLQLLKA